MKARYGDCAAVDADIQSMLKQDRVNEGSALVRFGSIARGFALGIGWLILGTVAASSSSRRGLRVFSTGKAIISLDYTLRARLIVRA
jgi:hypothetical protein